MSRKAYLTIVAFIFGIYSFFLFPIISYGVYRSSGSVQVNAVIGEYYLNLLGLIAPYASVVLTSGNYVLRSTVADSRGYFSFSQVLINRGFSNFCLTAVDIKRLGESYKCFNIPPANGDVTLNNIFLPPTLGLQRTTINAGQSALVWGYSMPGALVTIYLSDGRSFVVTADSSGFYQLTVNMPAAGTFQLFADATYQKQNSLKPDRKKALTVLAIGQQLVENGKSFLEKLWELLINTPFGPLWLALPLLLLILLLLHKLKPEWFTSIDDAERNLLAHLPFLRRKLHHWWFIGY